METQNYYAQRSDFIKQYNLFHAFLFQWKCLVSKCQKTVKYSRASVAKHLITHKLSIEEYEQEFGGPASIDPAQSNSSSRINLAQSHNQPSSNMEQWLTNPSTNPSDVLTSHHTDSSRTHTPGNRLPNPSGVPSHVSPSPRAWLKVPEFGHAV